MKSTKIALVVLSLTLTAAYLMTGSVSAAWAAGSTIAVVDMEKAVNDCKRGKSAQAQLRGRAEKMETELKQLGEEVQSLRRDLENSAMLLKPEARLKKENEFERKMRQFNDKKRDYQQEMMESQREVFAPILRSMTDLVKELGEKKGYNLVLESRAALYFPASADITAEVIAAFDKKNP